MITLKSVNRMSRTGGLVFALLSAVAGSITASAQTLTTLASFSGGPGGSSPNGGLIADASGNLFGTNVSSPNYGYGTVFEIANTTSGYASTPITLANFIGSGVGAQPLGSLVADANGNLFGTTLFGGLHNSGTVFEVVKTTSGYVSPPTTLVSFSPASGGPQNGLIIDANGNLFGTTGNVLSFGIGTVWELVNNGGTYASTPITLATFSGPDASFPLQGGALMEDTNGNLLGMTVSGGAYGAGSVFEIVNNGGTYASTPTTLVSFTNGADGGYPESTLIADANGNLFGTTASAGAYGSGTVFEIAKTTSGYASTPTTLASLDSGLGPHGSLIEDAGGNLFGTTAGSESYTGGVFEIVKSRGVYASTPTMLASFEVGDGSAGGLIADANGNLFGTTTSGGAYGFGSVFEITGSGFVPPGRQFAGTPGSVNCNGNSVSNLAHTYGGDAHAAQVLGYASVSALKSAVANYCGN